MNAELQTLAVYGPLHTDGWLSSHALLLYLSSSAGAAFVEGTATLGSCFVVSGQACRAQKYLVAIA